MFTCLNYLPVNSVLLSLLLSLINQEKGIYVSHHSCSGMWSPPRFSDGITETDAFFYNNL